nr:hypothetical protein [Tanacetum cinerariifolium]
MAARGGRNNLVARRVIDDLIDISRERLPLKYLKVFIEQQITDPSGDYEEVFDLVMELRDDKRDEQDKVADFNRLNDVAKEKIHGKEIDLEMLGAEGNNGYADPLVNYDNDNENDYLGYQSEEYFDEVQVDDENNHSNGNLVKRGITRLYKFHREYGKPDGIKLSVKSAAAKMARSKSVYQYTMRRGGYTLVKEKMIKKEIKPNEEPARGTLWLKGRVNKDEEYPDDEIRSVGDKLLYKVRKKEVMQEEWEVELHTRGILILLEPDKHLMKEFCYFKVNLIMRERRERQEKELLIQNLSSKLSQTEGMVTKLKNQLAAQGGQLLSVST